MLASRTGCCGGNRHCTVVGSGAFGVVGGERRTDSDLLRCCQPGGRWWWSSPCSLWGRPGRRTPVNSGAKKKKKWREREEREDDKTAFPRKKWEEKSCTLTCSMISFSLLALASWISSFCFSSLMSSSFRSFSSRSILASSLSGSEVEP